MRMTYRALAIAIVALVALQAASHAWVSAAIGASLSEGQAFDVEAFMAAPEFAGIIIHGLSGMYVIPAVALALLVVSFFTRIPRTVLWAGIIVALVAIQVALGVLAHGVTALAFIHGLNALILASAAGYAQWLARRPDTAAPISKASRSAAHAAS